MDCGGLSRCQSACGCMYAERQKTYALELDGGALIGHALVAHAQSTRGGRHERGRGGGRVHARGQAARGEVRWGDGGGGGGGGGWAEHQG